MSPEPAVHLTYVIVATGLLGVICWHDIATRLLPDGPILAVAALGFAWQMTAGNVAWSLAAAFVVFMSGAVVWRLGALGGGDVKLLAACAMLPGAAALPNLLVMTGFTGGLLALGYLIARRIAPAGPAPSRFLPARVWRAEARRMRRGGPLPYAVPIALGTIFAMLAEL